MTVVAFGTACGQAPEPVANDGIQVHGNWTVTVTNPDGTVDAVHEFENALNNPTGTAFLTALLAGETTISTTGSSPSGWQIHMGHTNTSSVKGAEAVTCQEAIFTGPTTVQIPAQVTRNVLIAGSPLTLTGVCTVQTEQITIAVSEVKTYFAVNFPSFKVGPGLAAQAGSFTKHELQENVTVANNQSLAFNVVISFS